MVTRNVNLRPDASRNGAPVETLKIGTKLELVETEQTNGFLRVKTEDGTEGWAWSRNLQVQTSGVAANAPHVGPANLYPNPSITPGLAATLSVDDLTKTYTNNCPGSKPSCTYSGTTATCLHRFTRKCMTSTTCPRTAGCGRKQIRHYPAWPEPLASRYRPSQGVYARKLS